MRKKKLNKIGALACTFGALSLFAVPCISQSESEKNADIVFQPKFEAPYPTNQLDVIQYICIRGGQSLVVSNVGTIKHLELPDFVSYTQDTASLQVTLSVSSGYDGKFYTGYFDYEMTSDPYTRAYIYVYPFTTSYYGLVTTDYAEFQQFIQDTYVVGGETYNQGYEKGYNVGKVDGYDNGYNVGYADGMAQEMDTTAFTIFNGILNVALLPINAFLLMLNFDVLGINISSLVMSALTVAMTIIVIRMFTGGKGGGGNA